MTSIASPLVIGYPRTGFTLLISVISEILTQAGAVKPRRHALKALCDTAGMQISASIQRVFERRGMAGDLLYNYNFRQMVGGPKWLKDGNSDIACFRKYIGVRGKGDFTLFTSHPRQVLEYYEIAHSHVAPALWPTLTPYDQYARFASMRHPAGTIASACFSLNALASEYIQRFVPPGSDNDLLRQKLGLYKLSDLNFFEALLKPFKTYADEFAGCAGNYAIMRWEDLLTEPVPTIRKVATELGLPVDDAGAGAIWARLDHVNLTGAHKHNLRVGHGRVGGWKGWLTNTHLEMIRDYGFGEVAGRYGYGPIEPLDPTAFTPFQQQVDQAIREGRVIREYDDEDLFGFAFNKSNLDLSRFAFKRYGWRDHTSIERSSCTDDTLVMETWDAAEAACATVNKALDHWFAEAASKDLATRKAAVEALVPELAPLFADRSELEACRAALFVAVELDEAEAGLGADFVVAPGAASAGEPQLLQSVGKLNIVSYRGSFIALPQSLGPVDFRTQDVAGLPGVIVAEGLAQILERLKGTRH